MWFTEVRCLQSIFCEQLWKIWAATIGRYLFEGHLEAFDVLERTAQGLTEKQLCSRTALSPPKRKIKLFVGGHSRATGALIRWWKPLSDSFFEQSRSSGCAGLQKIFLKCPLMLSENNTGLAGRSDVFSVFVPYPGCFADEQRPAWCVMQLLAKVQMPKSGLLLRALLSSWLLSRVTNL